MSKLRDDILAFENRMGERVEAVVIGRLRDGDDFEPHDRVAPVGRDEAMAMVEFDRDYDGGMGSRVPPNPIYAWTASWVLFLAGEEGGAGPTWLPRHPVACAPMVNGVDAASASLERPMADENRLVFDRILERATEVFGSRVNATRWLSAPAMALNQQRPMNLLAAPAGVELVEQTLGRMEHGGYL